MKPSEIQVQIFEGIKNGLPENLSLVDTIADLLNVSSDSAYRRIRGEKILDLDEVFLIAGKFRLSLDSFLTGTNNVVPFSFSTLSYEEEALGEYHGRILEFLKTLRGMEDKQVIFCAKDISIFHVYQVPEICAFKHFFYRKTNYGFETLKTIKFSEDIIKDFNLPIHRDLLKAYVELPVIDIVNENLIDSTLRQIQFYHDSSYFEKKDYVFEILSKLEKMIMHLEKQAELGYQFAYGLNPPDFGPEYRMYSNDIMLTDNTIQINMNGRLFSFITFNGTNYLYTDHGPFTNESQNYLNNLMKKSTRISSSGEKERNKYFQSLRDKVDLVRGRIIV